MKSTLTLIARLGLVLTILPSLLFFFDVITLPLAKWIMIPGTVLWLGLSPYIQKLHEQELS
ncbi:MAG: hypothetical protein KJT03_18495 [Verrucomicrobiae bacterium]|nr:hypothetical protein [Verrucomicrobiae bacterium]